MLHVELLRHIESLIADGLMMVEKRHPLVAAGWQLPMVEKPAPRKLDRAEWEAIGVHGRASCTKTLLH